MNLLAIETSTDIASVALCAGGQMFYAEQANSRQHAQVLLPLIEQLLHQGECEITQLDGIVFGAGPGSFTGLRIACSIAKALAYAHNKPLYAVSSLSCIASAVAEKYALNEPDTSILVMLDARMQQVYWANFNLGQIAHGQFNFEAQVSAPEAVHIPSAPCIVAGYNYEAYLSGFSGNLQGMQQEKLYPQAKDMLKLVQRGLIASVTAAHAEPMYVRNQVTHGASNG